jgi:hypothetical protein
MVKTRRTKLEMDKMRNTCTAYLLQTKLDPHKAYDLYIKEYLENGLQLEYYIKGIKDFIKVSQELKVKLKHKEAMRKADKEKFKKQETIKNYILNLTKEEIKDIYKQYKDKVSHAEKLELVNLVNFIYYGDMQEKYINNIMINLFAKIYNDFKKSA